MTPQTFDRVTSVVVACVVGMVLILGVRGIWPAEKPASSAAPDPIAVAIADLVTRVHALDEKVTQLAASRCMTVNTPVLNVAVYDTPNLGVQKMTAKEKKP
jgi:hypothetical protein